MYVECRLHYSKDFAYLAGFVVHVESDNSIGAPLSTLQQQQVSRQLIGQVGLSCSTGP